MSKLIYIEYSIDTQILDLQIKYFLKLEKVNNY